MFDGEYSRRTVLRRSLATAGAGAMAGIAGCSSIPNPFGGGAPYTNWLPAPDDLGDSDHYRFTYLNMDDLESHEDKFGDNSTDPDGFEEFWAPLDTDWEDTSNVTLFGGFGLENLVIEADFNKDDAISDLEDEDFDDDSDYNGYTIMLSDSEERAIAVSGSDIILTSATESSDEGTPSTGETGKVETIIDAKKGNSERYGEASEDMSALTGELGGGTFVSGGTREEPEEANAENGQFEAMVARGSQSKVKGDTTERKWVVVYESEGDVDTGDLEDWVGENDGSDGEFDDVDDLSYNKNGRKGIITGKSNTDNI